MNQEDIDMAIFDRPKDTLILNRNRGMDVLHRSAGLTESCNSDDVIGREKVDAKTAASLIASGSARPCQHCIGPDDEPT